MRKAIKKPVEVRYYTYYDLCKFKTLRTYDSYMDTLPSRDIHYVAHEKRDTLEFCIMLDKKFIKSKKGFDEWLKLAVENEYIKITEEVTDYYEHRYK